MYRKTGKRGRGATSVQRQVANERERKRMQTIGDAFDTLKKCIPWIPNDTKLSKADTLRLAALYMDYLSHILRQDLQAAEITAAIAMQKWPWQKTAFQFDEWECGRAKSGPLDTASTSITTAAISNTANPISKAPINSAFRHPAQLLNP